MEPAPSAQIVGQEFVKQYYTMLNAAPEHLHRYACLSLTERFGNKLTHDVSRLDNLRTGHLAGPFD